MSDAWDDMKIVTEISDKARQENADRLNAVMSPPSNPVTLHPEKLTVPVLFPDELISKEEEKCETS